MRVAADSGDHAMKLIVGLGNPGRKYAGTRHNVGFDVLDLLSERHRLEWESGPADALVARWRIGGALLAKPLTFMNLSGLCGRRSVALLQDRSGRHARRRGRCEPGARAAACEGFRIRPAGHNGLKSLIEQLGRQLLAAAGRCGAGGQPGAISRTTCWRSSMRRSGQWSRRPWAAPPMRPSSSFGKALGL